MSSGVTSCSLNIDDLRLLQKVLIDCGYTCEIAGGQSAGSNLAAKMLIRLFQDGMTDPIDLADELVRRFGRTKMALPVAERRLHKNAIRGLYSPSHGGRWSK